MIILIDRKYGSITETTLEFLSCFFFLKASFLHNEFIADIHELCKSLYQHYEHRPVDFSE